MVELSISSYLFLHKYCDFAEQGEIKCKPPTKTDALVFYIAIYQIALGNGAYQPAITTLGADQFDESDTKERKSKTAFFGYFFVANNLGSVVAVTALTYIEDKGSWVLAFWISTAAAVAALLLFLIGTLRYRYFMPNPNAILSVCQVFVASAKNRQVKIPQREEDLYEVDGTHSTNGARKMLHTPDYRYSMPVVIKLTKYKWKILILKLSILINTTGAWTRQQWLKILHMVSTIIHESHGASVRLLKWKK
jgi:solute carrier family 15 (peptide/histidine transporter), member 3/4